MIRDVHSGRLLIGNARDARDLAGLYDNRIAAVVDLAIDEPPAQLGRDIIYCRFPLHDGDGNSLALIAAAIRCTATLVEEQLRTLISCGAGMSRSPAIAAAALALITAQSPDACLARIAANAPHDVSPLLWARVKAAHQEIAGKNRAGEERS